MLAPTDGSAAPKKLPVGTWAQDVAILINTVKHAIENVELELKKIGGESDVKEIESDVKKIGTEVAPTSTVLLKYLHMLAYTNGPKKTEKDPELKKLNTPVLQGQKRLSKGRHSKTEQVPELKMLASTNGLAAPKKLPVGTWAQDVAILINTVKHAIENVQLELKKIE